MAKPRHNSQTPEASSRGMLAILAIGALLVAGLVVWALTRTVETTPEPTSSIANATPAPAPAPVETTTATATTAPIASSTGAITTSSDAQPPTANEANFPRIAAEDLREKMKAGRVTVIDVRPPLSFEADHITGSVNMALASVESSLGLLPPDKNTEIVTYCTCPAEESSIAAGLILNKHGYNKVSALFGGLAAWRNLGYPVERGLPK